MMPSLSSLLPVDLSLVQAADIFGIELDVASSSTSRTLSMVINGVSVLSWALGVVTTKPGYTGSATEEPTKVIVNLSCDGGWPLGESTWDTAYSDSDGSVSTHVRFARTNTTLAISAPFDGQAGTPRHPHIYIAYDVFPGTAVGMDLDVDGQAAITRGLVMAPAFEGSSGAVGGHVFAGVTSRRAFGWASSVAVVAKPRVSFSGNTYTGRLPYTFTTADAPGSVTWAPDPPALENPVAEAVRQRAASTLRKRGVAPSLLTACVFYLMRSDIGRLATAYSPRGAFVSLRAEDLPSSDEIIELVRDVDPLWRALVGTECPSEDVEAVNNAWQSRHPVEQLGALCLLIFYALGGRNGL